MSILNQSEIIQCLQWRLFDRMTQIYRFQAIIFTLYIYFHPLGSLLFGGEQFDLMVINEGATNIYIIILIFLLIVPVSVLIKSGKKKYFDVENFQLSTPIEKTQIIRLYIGLVICLLLLLTLLTQTNIDYTVFFNRNNRDSGIFITQTWVILVVFLESITFISIFYYSNLNIFFKCLVFVNIALFAILELVGLGGRRNS